MTIVIPDRCEENIVLLVAYIYELYPKAKIVISHDSTSRGKGWALRQGLPNATTPLIFIDGDYDIKPEMIARLLPFLDEYDVVVGKKNLPSDFRRKLITIFSRLYIRLLFGIGVDTQTGVKAFNYIPEWKTDGWGCDIEILYKAKKMNKKMLDVPVQSDVSGSKTFNDLWSTLWESLRIRFSR